MKTRLLPLICGAAILATIPFWNTNASAQPDSSTGRSGLKPPINRNCIVTMDARSNSRASMSQEMQRTSGFVRQDTAEGTLVHVDAAWIVLKNLDGENWIPRDKVLMLRATQRD